MRFKRAYGILSLLFFVFLGVSCLAPVVRIPKGLVGAVGLDIGTFLFERLGILGLSIPLVGIVLSVSLLMNRFKRGIYAGLFVFLLAFTAELGLGLWMPHSRWGGALASGMGEALKRAIGSLGSGLLFFSLVLIIALLLGFDRLLAGLLTFRPRFRAKGSSGTVSEGAGHPKEPVGPSATRAPEAHTESMQVSSVSKVESTPKVEERKREGLKIVEGGGELAEVLTPKQEEQEDQEPVAVRRPGEYRLPEPSLLGFVKKEKRKVNPKELEEKAALLEEKLRDFGVSGKVVSVHYGPVVSMFEYKPAPGVKVSKILNLQDDIAVVMKAGSVRVVAPIPGKDTIGIELPNDERETVYFTEILASDAFRDSKSPLTLILGKDIFGKPFVTDLRKMPHLLVAGATGSGKSVGLNSMICSILFKSTPDVVKFILVDPKMLEFSVYNGIPHLITPVITDPKKAATALSWAVSEMERRYRPLSEAGVRNIERYNAKAEEQMPYIVVVIDELADLMMVAGKDVEMHIARLAQKARAAGIHLIVATQRPSVDVITGLIKANFPSRISFKVSSKVDSRTILDTIGAEKLLGNGDMLFMPPGKSELIRLHGAYISDREIEAVAEFWKRQAEPEYNQEIFEKPKVNGVSSGSEEVPIRDDYDELYDEAVEFVSGLGYASASLLQRHFKIGYNRAARLIEMMEKEGIVGPAQGSKPREVLIRKAPRVNLPDDVEEQ